MESNRDAKTERRQEDPRGSNNLKKEVATLEFFGRRSTGSLGQSWETASERGLGRNSWASLLMTRFGGVTGVKRGRITSY